MGHMLGHFSPGMLCREIPQIVTEITIVLVIGVT